MVQGDVSPTGSYVWYVDGEGNGHNIPLQGDINGNLKISGNTGLVVKESFDETDLQDGAYSPSSSVIGFGIINNNTTNSLTFTINGISIPIPAGSTFYDEFELFSEITITGTTLDFDAYVKGD